MRGVKGALAAELRRRDSFSLMDGDCRRGGAFGGRRTASYGPALSMMRRTKHIPTIRPTMPIVCSTIFVLGSDEPGLESLVSVSGRDRGPERTSLRDNLTPIRARYAPVPGASP